MENPRSLIEEITREIDEEVFAELRRLGDLLNVEPEDKKLFIEEEDANAD